MKMINQVVSAIVIAILIGCSDPAKCVFSVKNLKMKTIEQGENGVTSFIIYNKGERKLSDHLICRNPNVKLSNGKLEINPGDSVVVDITVNGDKIGRHNCEVINTDSTCTVIIEYNVDYALNEKIIEQLMKNRVDRYIQSSSMWMLNTYIGSGGENGYAFGFTCDKKLVERGVKNGILRYVGTGNGNRHYCFLTSNAKGKYKNGNEYILNRFGGIKVLRFGFDDEFKAEAEVEITMLNNEIGAVYWDKTENVFNEKIYLKKYNDGWKIAN